MTNTCCLADYASYMDCQERVSEAYRDQQYWTRMSILNAAGLGKFSSDQLPSGTIVERIWKVKPVPVLLG